jgi:chromate transporter
MIFLQLFLVYLKIGLFNFGGGYAMLSLIQDETVDRRRWITMQEFTDIVAISQATPGPIGINSATYVGYAAALNAGYPPQIAVLGSCTATLAVCLPSFVLVLAVSHCFTRFRKNRFTEAAFLGLRPAATGLIAAAALLLMNGDNFTGLYSFLIFGATFLLVWKFKLHPVTAILLAGLAGLLIYR